MIAPYRPHRLIRMLAPRPVVSRALAIGWAVAAYLAGVATVCFVVPLW